MGVFAVYGWVLLATEFAYTCWGACLVYFLHVPEFIKFFAGGMGFFDCVRRLVQEYLKLVTICGSDLLPLSIGFVSLVYHSLMSFASLVYHSSICLLWIACCKEDESLRIPFI